MSNKKEFIDKNDFINYLKNWKKSLDTSFQDEVVGVVLDVVLKKVQALPKIENDGWVLCSERLPDFEEPEDGVIYEKEYLVTIEDAEEATVLYFDVDGEFRDEYNMPYDVVAWQPLPEAYKPKEEPKEEAAWKESMMAHFTKGD